ncbi:MAG: hypothetical protein V3W19_11475 [Desulfatiglandales bacterium]
MTLAKSITDQLQKAPSGHPGEIQAAGDEFRVEVKLADCDRLGCLLNRLELEQSQGGLPALDASSIEGQITYLGERLEVIETEGRKGRTILRSAPPRINGDVTSFFEMVLDPVDGLSLVRYEYDRQRGERIPVAAALARDTLERLINDLIELAQKKEVSGS